MPSGSAEIGELGDGGGKAEPAERPLRPRGEQVGRAHPAEVRNQLHEMAEANRDAFRIDHRQRESGAAEQVAGGTDVDLGMDVGRRGDVLGLFGGAKRGAQPRQAAGAGEGGEEQPVGLRARAESG